MKRILQVIVLITGLLVMLTTMATAQAEKSIVTILAEDGRFTTLLKAIEITETEQAFSEGHWTLFAPTDAAFAEIGLNAENIGSQLGLGQTVDLLLYQAMNKEVTTDGAKDMLGDVTMANGWLAGLKWYDDSLWVNDVVRVIEPNNFASNGILHVTNGVITPPWPRVEEVPDVALMASIEEAKLLQAEEEAAVEEIVMDTAEEAGETEEMEEEPVIIPPGSVLDVMAKDGRFTVYLDAVGALDLIVPYTEGEWTIFAPTDAAFAAEGLDADNILETYGVGQLADLLMYHAMDEEVSVDKAKTMLGDVTMRNGQLAGLKFFDDLVWVNDHARLIDPDIQATNGVIHALDAVIERPWPRVEKPIEIGLEQSGDTP